MTTLTERFPYRVALGFEGGSGYLTEIAQVPGGKQKRNSQRQNSLGRWRATQLTKRHNVTQELIKFFHAAGGSLNDFPYRDWTDFNVASGDGIFETIDATHFQLQKRYIKGGVTRTRDIIRPLSTITVVGTGNYSVSLTTGILTVNSGANPTGWYGQFDLLCIFGQDDLAGMRIVDRHGPNAHEGFLYTWGDISIEEVRP